MKNSVTNNRKRTATWSVARLRRRWRIVSAVIIVLWAAWALLDAFVIPRDIIAVEEAGAALTAAPGAESGSIPIPDIDLEAGSSLENEEPWIGITEPEMDEEPPVESDEPIITDHSYDDGRIKIEISTMRMLDTNIYIAEVEITDPSCLRTALAGGAFGRNLTEATSEIAERNGAIFAVNGDYYGFRDTGYVMRNGYLYRSVPAKDPDQEDLVLYEDGSIDILREADMTAEEMSASGATDIFSFGPGLVYNGEINVSRNDEVARAQVTNPRTAIGLLSPLHYLFVVSDGRTDESIGLSLYELAGLMKDLGCVTAYNLDGGGSSTMWFNGEVLNHPTTFGEKIAERSVSDIVYIGK